MLRVILSFFCFYSIFLFTYAIAQENPKPWEEEKLTHITLYGKVKFGYDYSFGFSKVENDKVLKDKNNSPKGAPVSEYGNNYLTLDERFRNYIYIQNANLGLKANFAKIITANFSGSIISNGLSEQALTNSDDFLEFNKFLSDRKRNIKNLWQRYLLIQDVNFLIKDQDIDGSLTVGQHIVPFNYITNSTLNPPVIINPMITPMSEYINFNLRNPDDTPYQNSTMTYLRDIGATLSGDYKVFRFMSGIYNGAGPNTFDNNNEKDIFGRTDYILPNIGEIGVSHWRGKHIGYKKIYNNNPQRGEFEMYRTGLHGKLGGDTLYLLGEVIISQDRWLDKTDVDQLGWYIEGTLKVEKFFTGTLRYESFLDNNVLKTNISPTVYNLKRFVASMTQGIGEYINIREEYSHTWEDLNEKSVKTFSNYGIASVNVELLF